MLKVIYIAGAGRSGSTVLDTILGNHPEIESLGEVVNAPRAWENPSEYCACGIVAGNCPFWNDVRSRWKAIGPSIGSVSNWKGLQARYERLRWVYRSYLNKYLQTASFREYAKGIEALYTAIAHKTGKQFIVDSSKNPVRALALTRMKSIELVLIHLIRDGRGVAWSYNKPYKKNPKKGIQFDMLGLPVWRSALGWIISNKITEVAKGQLPEGKSLRIFYEDFVQEPERTLLNIGGLCGLDFSSVISDLQNNKVMKVGHTIAGNRVRMDGAIKLRADLEWKKYLSHKQLRLFWLFAGRMASRYGYNKTL